MWPLSALSYCYAQLLGWGGKVQEATMCGLGSWRCREQHTLTAGGRQTTVDSGWSTENHNLRHPQSPKDRHVYLLFLIVFCHVSKNLSPQCSFMSLYTSISVSTLILHVTLSQFCLYSLIFITLYIYLTGTHRGTHTQAHMHDQHTRGLATTSHMSLAGRGGKDVLMLNKGLALFSFLFWIPSKMIFFNYTCLIHIHIISNTLFVIVRGSRDLRFFQRKSSLHFGCLSTA